MYGGNTVGFSDDSAPQTPGCTVGTGGQGVADDVWEWTAPATEQVCVNTGGTDPGFDTILYLQDDCDGAEFECDDDGFGANFHSALDFDAVAGETYYIWVDGWNAFDEGTYSLTIEPCPLPPEPCDSGDSACEDSGPVDETGPTADTACDSGDTGCTPPVFECPTAAAILTDYGITTGTTVGGGDDSEPITCGFSTSEDQLVEFVAPVSELVCFDLNGTPYDTIIHVETACGDDGSEVACNDDFFGLQSAANVDVIAGETYYVWVDGFSSSAGDYTLNIRPGDCSAPPIGGDTGEEVCDSGDTGCSTADTGAPDTGDSGGHFEGVTECFDFDDVNWAYYASANNTVVASNNGMIELTPDDLGGASGVVVSTTDFMPPFAVSFEYMAFDDDGLASNLNRADGVGIAITKDRASYLAGPPPGGATHGIPDDGTGFSVDFMTYASQRIELQDGDGTVLANVGEPTVYSHGAWRSVHIGVAPDEVVVIYEGNEVITHSMVPDPTYGAIVLGAGTGGADSQHQIRNVCVTTFAPPVGPPVP